MRMKTARVLPVFLVFTLAFAAAGCLVPVGNVDLIAEEATMQIDLTPEELLEKVVEAYQGVLTFQTDMKMTTGMKILIQGEITFESSYQMRSSSMFDVINRRLMATMIMEATMPPEPGFTMEMEMEMYWLDGLVYAHVSGPDMPSPIWMKGKMPWVCPLEQTVDLLKVSEIDILSVEEVNGLESYLIKVTPDLGKLGEVLREGMMGPGMPLVMRDIEREEVSMKKWIARDTFLVVKEQLYLSRVREGREIKLSRIARFYNFNEPVLIELPPEAEEAAIWGPGAAPPPPPSN